MTNTTYCTIDELKARLHIDPADAADDDMLQQMLNSAAMLVDKYTRDPLEGYEAFTASSSEARLFDHVMRQDGYYPIDDCLTVTAVTIGGTSISSTYYQLYPLNRGNGPATHIKFRFDTTNITGAGNAWYEAGKGWGQISITGTWGYCTQANRPAAIKECTLALAVIRYEMQNLSSKDLLQAMTNPTTAKMKLIKDELSPYRKDRSTGGLRLA